MIINIPHRVLCIITTILLVLVCSCKETKTQDEIAVLKVVTHPFSAINDTSVICNGEVISQGESEIINRGFCWSMQPNPTIESFKISSGKGIGKFTRTIRVLDPKTNYYIRAYASNSTETVYGETLLCTTDASPVYIFNPYLTYGIVHDKEGNEYKTITIGQQTWMAQNLRTSIFENGDSIYSTNNNEEWLKSDYPLQTPYSSFNHKDSLNKYGRHYNWEAITDKRKIAPKGWHVATETDWVKLEKFLIENRYNINENDNQIAKSMASSSCWKISTQSGSIGLLMHKNNKCGFTAIPATIFNNKNEVLFSSSYWWSYSQTNVEYNCRILYYNNSSLLKTYISKHSGLSVRCVKDE